MVSARGLKLNALTAAQAMVPTSCSVIQNLVGTAPIMWFERDGKVLVAMPGVPFETEQMMRRSVMARLIDRFPSTEFIERRVVMVCGMSESAIAGMIAPWEDSLPQHAHLAYLPKPGVVRLRIDCHHHDKDFLTGETTRLHAELARLIPADHLLAVTDLTPEEILLNELRQRGLSFASAESCTGGSIARRITAIPGSSSAFKGSVVAYANEVKSAVLGVNAEDIAAHGAVSQTVVEQMAAGARDRLGADIAVATSGIAGPGGGSDDKPVGTVWIATATPEGVHSCMHHFPGSRDRVIDRAATTAILSAIESLRRL